MSSTEAGRPRVPRMPLPPAVPPRPAGPPRPRERAAAPEPEGAEPLPRDEATRQVASGPRAPRDSGRPATVKEGEPGSGEAARPMEDAGSTGTARPEGEAEPAGATPRRPPRPPATAPPEPSRPPVPAPAVPPQPQHPPESGPFGADDVAGPPTFRLKPIRIETGTPGRRRPSRAVAAAACLVLGVGLLGGTTAGIVLDGRAEAGTPRQVFEDAREMWHSVPVNGLFARTVHGAAAGPGGADRNWIRVAVAPDSPCSGAVDRLLARALAPVGCRRLVRATYLDETGTDATTVGLVFTEADPAGMRRLQRRFAREELDRRSDLMPRAYGPRGTPAAGFGDAQRGSWTVDVLTDAPVVVLAVSGFADGRTVQDPRPAAEATAPEASSVPAQAGLGHEAESLASHLREKVRKRLRESREGGTP
ncbi:hypothetical protein [Streptomyces sp. TR06-5]|uniref:hypothetical protein n=1 Tax=unclassified Streptomyces TaxID=2593676 RepID=UPI0039A1766E